MKLDIEQEGGEILHSETKGRRSSVMMCVSTLQSTKVTQNTSRKRTIISFIPF